MPEQPQQVPRSDLGDSYQVAAILASPHQKVCSHGNLPGTLDWQGYFTIPATPRTCRLLSLACESFVTLGGFSNAPGTTVAGLRAHSRCQSLTCQCAVRFPRPA